MQILGAAARRGKSIRSGVSIRSGAPELNATRTPTWGPTVSHTPHLETARIRAVAEIPEPGHENVVSRARPCPHLEATRASGWPDGAAAGLVRADLLRAVLRDAPFEMTVRGVSMLPDLPDGTRLRVRRHTFLLPGDVVIFRAVEHAPLVAHRLLGLFPWRGEWRFIAQGDAVPRPDSPAAISRLVGIGVTRVPLSTRVQSAARFFSWGLARIVSAAGGFPSPARHRPPLST